MIPNDPIMLMSYLNTQLRDFYPTLNDLEEGLDISIEEVCAKLDQAGYRYDSQTNRFISK